MPSSKELVDYITEVAQTLVRINTENPPGREREAAGYVSEKLAELGLKTTIQELAENRANVVAVLEGRSNKPTIMLNTHLDTVPVGDIDKWPKHPLKGIIEDGKLYGRGAADAKASVAAMLGALKLLVEENEYEKLDGRVIFAAVADEETTGLGSVHLVKSGYSAEYTVIGEPTGLALCNGNRGRIEFTLTLIGRAAHASLPKHGVNAIKIASEVLERLTGLKLGNKDDLSITMISGGIKPNVIPDYCQLKIDYRESTGKQLDKIRSKIENTVRKIVRRYRGAAYEFKISNYSPAVITDSKSPIVRAALDSLREMNLKRKLFQFPATTDLSRITQHINTQGIIIGPGRLEVSHTTEEYVKIKEIEDASKIYLKIIKKLLKRTR